MRFRSRVPVPSDLLFDWHARDGAFDRLAPPWQRVEVISREGSITDGDVLVMRVGAGPLSKKWIALHSDFAAGKQFRDTQIEGPFASWSHLHRIHRVNDNESTLDDEVSFELPLQFASHRLVGRVARSQIQRMFRFRHLRTRLDVWRHHIHLADRRHAILVLGNHPLASQIKAFVLGGGHTIVEDGDASAVIDLRNIAGNGQRPGFIDVHVFDFPVHSSPTDTLRITLPDLVIGQTFLRLLPIPLIGDPRWLAGATPSSWVSEDDLIGLMYRAIGQPQRDSAIHATAAVLQHLPDFQPAWLNAVDAYRALQGHFGKSCTIDV